MLNFETVTFRFGRRRNWRDTSGATAVEFALVLPVFLLLTIGMIAYGIYFGAAHSTAQLAADAARASIGGAPAPTRGMSTSPSNPE